MTLIEIVNSAKEQCIYKLSYNGSVLGLRVQVFNTSKQSFEYYDFDLDTLKENRRLYEYLRDNQSKFKSKSLVKENGRYYTQEELNGEYEAGELTTLQKAEAVLKPVVKFYQRGYI